MVRIFISSPLFFPWAPSLLGDRKRLERRKSSLLIYSWLFHLIFMSFFQDYLGAEQNLLPWRQPGPKIRFQLQWAQWMKDRERWIDREGTRERGFMCSLVNERLALKVTGCVYYWSVSRLMGSREEERAELLSRDQSTQAWEQEEAPSNKLCHSRSACSHRSGDNAPACWTALAGN